MILFHDEKTLQHGAGARVFREKYRINSGNS